MGYPREDLVGKDLIDFYHPEDQKRGKTSRNKFLDLQTQELTIERRLIDANNQTKSFILNVRKSSASSVYDSILTLSDITAAKEAEEKLKRLVEMDELTGLFSRRGLNRRFGFDQRYEDLGMYLIESHSKCPEKPNENRRQLLPLRWRRVCSAAPLAGLERRV
jgi:hypothetical protein